MSCVWKLTSGLLFLCALQAALAQRLRSPFTPAPRLRTSGGDDAGPQYHELYTDDVSIGTCGFGLDGAELAKGNFAYVFDVTPKSLENSYLKGHSSVYSDVQRYANKETKYVIKINTEDGSVGKTEFEMQKLAAAAGIAPKVVAGWTCSGRDEYQTTAAILMERMAVSVETLMQKVEKQLQDKTLTVEQAVPLLALVQRGMLGAIERLGQLGVKHGDEFVGNFMLDYTGRVKAIDFGMASKVPAENADALRKLAQSLVVSHFLEKASFLQRAGIDLQELAKTSDPANDQQLLFSAGVQKLLGQQGEPYQWGRFAAYIDASVGARALLVQLIGQKMAAAPEQGGVQGGGSTPPPKLGGALHVVHA